MENLLRVSPRISMAITALQVIQELSAFIAGQGRSQTRNVYKTRTTRLVHRGSYKMPSSTTFAMCSLTTSLYKRQDNVHDSDR